MAVLDLGSGEGRFALPAARVASKVHAVDLSDEAVKYLLEEASRLGLDNVTASVADISGDLGLDGEFDFAIMSNVLHGLALSEAADRALENARKALRPGGVLLVVEFKPEAGSPPGPPANMRISRDDVVRLASRHGFEPVDSFEAGPFHYAVVLRRTR